jgi:hypothetical protein
MDFSKLVVVEAFAAATPIRFGSGGRRCDRRYNCSRLYGREISNAPRERGELRV